VSGGGPDSTFHRGCDETAVAEVTQLVLQEGAPTVQVTVQGRSLTFIIDTGSVFSLVKPGKAKLPLESTTLEPFGVTGDTLAVLGKQEIWFQMGISTFKHSFLVCELPTAADGILGVNFLSSRRARLDLGDMLFAVFLDPALDFRTLPRQHSCYGECGGKEGRGLITHVSYSNHLSRAENARGNRQDRDSREGANREQGRAQTINSPANESGMWLVTCKESVVLQPRAKHTVLGKVQGGKWKNSSCFFLCRAVSRAYRRHRSGSCFNSTLYRGARSAVSWKRRAFR
jgi:hypothetical protein